MQCALSEMYIYTVCVRVLHLAHLSVLCSLKSSSFEQCVLV